MTNIETLEVNLERIHGWIRAADQKVSTLFAAEGVMLTLATPYAVSWFTKSYTTAPWPVISLLFLSLFLFLYSLVKLGLVLLPRLKNPTKDYYSTTFFEHISRMSLGEYQRLVGRESSSAYRREIVSQIYFSSLVCTGKHTLLRDALLLLMLSLVSIIGVILFNLEIYIAKG